MAASRDGRRLDGNDLHDGNPGTGAGSTGKRTLTAALAPSTTSVARAVMRLMRAAENDDNGVGSGAEALVGRAGSSSGAPLPQDVRGRFEGSLGADLSAVRVHTGADSAAAAESVSARAYTTGQDIHFAAGQYQPADPFGIHLLAHEVAHTVQQSGGTAPAGRPQYQLEVSTPGDALEVEADRAADAMVSGEGARVGSARGLSRQAIQRDTNFSSSNPASRGDQQMAQEELNKWRLHADEVLIDTCGWYSNNFTKFLELTGCSPQLAWTDSKYFGPAVTLVKYGLKKVVTKGAASALGVQVGSAAGPAGMILGLAVGFAVGQVIDAIVAELKPAGKKEAECGRQTAHVLGAANHRFLAQVKQGQEAVAAAFDQIQRNINAATDNDVLTRILTHLGKEARAVVAPPSGDLSLFDQMYADWVLEHAGTNTSAGANTNPAQWATGVKDAKGLDGRGVKDRIDLFAYQTRGHWAAAGLSTDAAQQMIDDSKEGDPRNSRVGGTRPVDRWAGKRFQFTVAADPARLWDFITENYKGNSWLRGGPPRVPPENRKDIDSGNFQLGCTLYLADCNDNTSGFATYITKWEYVVTLPLHRPAGDTDAGQPEDKLDIAFDVKP